MKRQSKFIQERTLSEFVYTVAKESPASMKRLLPNKFFKATLSEKAAIRLATKSSLDEKRSFLAHMGIRCFMVFSSENDLWSIGFKKIVKQFENEEYVKGLKDATEIGVVVTSDKELVFNLGLMAHTMNTPIYERNMELVRAGYSLKKWHKKLSCPEINMLKEDTEQYQDLVKSLLSASVEIDNSATSIGLSPDQLKILFYYFVNRNRYVAFDEIKKYFLGLISGLGIARAEKGLREAMLVQKNVHKKDRENTITAAGILVISNFLKLLNQQYKAA